MGGLSIWHWIVVGAVVFIFFGGKFKISDVMGDVAKGIKAFKKGLSEPDTPEDPAKALDRLAQEQIPLDKTGDAKKV
ncbi:twin-arginine translocase TatA/TatE family subunit [Methylocystis bryophila]|uniref:Sec-independent protein translocase protein TatA n=1 Tax=Methylocystis bryophila TaxID=655015 RepID=A0A1W6MWH7_9HYPH|nr:twin-arginine translocase TatA/TatE family subunit [Methylocystis bryophila]ARN81905.1 Sec-independent protein translocase TatA [Methylocystis bryophila]BDV37990.1 Sec-independent protein translocase protein TatA [Methylocystis bryophila]